MGRLDTTKGRTSENKIGHNSKLKYKLKKSKRITEHSDQVLWNNIKKSCMHVIQDPERENNILFEYIMPKNFLI